MPSSHVFATFIGPMGVAWQGSEIVAVQLPGRTAKSTLAALAERVPGVSVAPPPHQVKQWVQKITKHVRGDLQDFSAWPVSLSGVSEFGARVYDELRSVPAGKMITYGELGTRAGRAGASRAVGRLMGRNPLPLIVPCHRVVGHDGGLTGFTSTDGIALKQKLLQLERVQFVSYQRLDWDPHEAIATLSASDKKLARLLARVGPFNLVHATYRSPYEALFRSIVFQQLAGAAAKAILSRVLALYDGFPTPEQLLKTPTLTLRAQGLSQSKILALQDLSRHAISGLIPLRFQAFNKVTDEEIIARCTQVRGIGPWTVQMMLIFGMGRADVFPVDDFAIRKAFTNHFGRELKARELMRFSERWAPYRSLVSWYLWQSLALP